MKALSRGIVSVVVFAVCIFALLVFPQNANAAQEDVYGYDVINGQAIIVSVKKTISGDVTLPSTLGGYPVTAIGDKAFYECKSLTSLVIPEGVTSIGEEAFLYCNSMESITIPKSMTSISRAAFWICLSLNNVYITDLEKWCNISFNGHNSNPMQYGDNLYLNGQLVTTLVIPESVTSIPDQAFKGCGSLTDIVFHDKVTSIGALAFADCHSLTKLNLPSSITYIGASAFQSCINLKGVYITDLEKWCNIRFGDYDPDRAYDNEDTNPLYYAWNLYLNNKLITDLVIPESVTSISPFAFIWCKSLKSVTFHENVQHVGIYAFYECQAIENIYISDIEKWCNINFEHQYSNPLYYATSLYLNDKLISDLVIPDGVTAISNYAFRCANIKSVTIPGSVKSIGSCAFADCSSLTELNLSEGLNSISNYAFGNCSGLTKIVLPESVTEIGSGAFYNNESATSIYITDLEKWLKIDFDENTTHPSSIQKKLYLNGQLITSVIIPDSITVICDYAFLNCKDITSVTLHSKVVRIGKCAFSGCSLTNIAIPDSVTEIGDYAFFDCDFTDITIPYSVTEIGEYAFRNCKNLIGIVIPDSVTKIGMGAFMGCSSLANAALPKGLTVIPFSLFSSCSNLTEIDIPDDITTIGGSAFLGCPLTKIDIPDGVTKIGEGAFKGCNNLTSIVIPYGVAEISLEAFMNCTALTNVVIPNSVTSIDGRAFENCSSLTEIFIPKSVTKMYEPFDDRPTLTIYVQARTFLEGWTWLNALCPIVYGYGAVRNITLDNTSISLSSLGEAVQLSATVGPDNAIDKEVIWHSSDEGVATVDQNGLITATGKGEAIITATTVDGDYDATCQVSVELPVEPNAEPDTSPKPSSTATEKPPKNNIVLITSISAVIMAVITSALVVTKKRKGK